MQVLWLQNCESFIKQNKKKNKTKLTKTRNFNLIPPIISHKSLEEHEIYTNLKLFIFYSNLYL